jgi:predicted membrane metal-binding protein
MSLLNLHVRHVRFEDVGHYVEMMGSNLWAFRHMPLVAILAGIGFFMTRRWYHTSKFKKPLARAMEGRRESDIKEL